MIKVLFFAHLKEQVGTEMLEFEASGMTIERLLFKLEKEYSLPALNTIMVAVNEEFEERSYQLKAGDIVALIPPVSGG
ncbi:molybdopterin synthase sulfur carrier subunit [Bacillus pakistanensis]|uniref:Molybdopterin synthase sulfur carrier subunit n=1 Tax=Rossellomorea pakistanensis TaxID=992288 RepID=A0ABS2NBG9_9BACI|nr:molybdopterin converting factor subunit 1 [Bacillus pakistanensis]MBM7585192.1 molybdopterin synthase sulfur carrier subunit [Bacillus pakistanensis]